MDSAQLLERFGPRQSMSYDVVIVGAGVAGLATAITLKQLAKQQQQELSVVVLEKAAEVGSHVLSGCVMDSIALTELLPNWQQMNAPIKQLVTQEQMLWLTNKFAFKIPQFLTPKCFTSNGCYVVSLSQVTKWLANVAENLGVEIFPGFAAQQVIYNSENKVAGIVTVDMGLDKNAQPTENFQLGMELLGKYTIFAEGSRGSLGKELINHYQLDANSDVQKYSIGIKEVWQIEPQQHQVGKIIHTTGWPLDNSTYGGGFVYHAEQNKLYLGLVVGLDYNNPYLSPYDEMQRFKLHPAIKKYLTGNSRRLEYGARSLTVGGLSCLPKLTFPGGLMVGCEAGVLNASRIKGSHTAIKSGILAAQEVAKAIFAGQQHTDLVNFDIELRKDWLYRELNQGRNFKQWFKFGRWVASAMTVVERWLLKGKFAWTIHNKTADYKHLQSAQVSKKIDYPKPDGIITFDKPSSVFASNVYHPENQPVHLKVADMQLALQSNQAIYAGPEQRYCPAGVYEYISNGVQVQLHINASNCLHCKTCDIKDPNQNINWQVPETGGPSYSQM